MGSDGLARSVANARIVARRAWTGILDLVECRRSFPGGVLNPAELRNAPSKLVAGLASGLICRNRRQPSNFMARVRFRHLGRLVASPV